MPPPPQRYEKNTAYLYGMQGRATYRLYPKGGSLLPLAEALRQDEYQAKGYLCPL